MDIIHTLSLGRGTPWGPDRSDLARSGTDAENGTVDAGREAAAAVSDPVSLSPRAQIRLDVARDAESTRRDDGDSTHHEALSADSVSQEERERLRELNQQDLQVRSGDPAVLDEDTPLRGSPMFDVVFGPLGRAYAVDEGVVIDPPKDRTEQASDAANEPIAPFGVEVVPAEAESRELRDADDEKVRLETMDSLGSKVASLLDLEPPTVEGEPGTAKSVTVTETETERYAAAYHAAANLAAAPGGTEPGSAADDFG